MDSIRQAVILLSPLASGYRILFEQDIAGLRLFQRLLLTLQRAGIKEFIILSKHLTEEERLRIDNRLKSDFRFMGKLSWVDQKRFLQKEDAAAFRTLENSCGFLLLEGNRVTTPGLIEEFIKCAWRVDTGIKSQIAQLTLSEDAPAKVFIFPPHSSEQLAAFLKNESIDESIVPIVIEGEQFLLQTVEGALDGRQAESELIRKCKFHYSQFMDKWFNSQFSLPISSALVKTPLTPNQITLLGLLIGLSAGWFFSLGNYLGGLLGGMLLVGTAIWDCCADDVARLKFMESDFGKALDTSCDNIINVFIFTGMMIGTAGSQGMIYALVPFSLLLIGGVSIFVLIYFPKGGKGNIFQDTWMYGVIQVLASRNFIYIILIFAVCGRVDLFLWVAGVGSILFAIALLIEKRRLTLPAREYSKNIPPSPTTDSNQ
jgi:phosphatidylglycerophosphate synthase